MAVPALVKQYAGLNTDALTSGRVFCGVQPVAGATLLPTATTGGFPTIWNPAGSGVNIAILNLELALLDDAAHTGCTLGWYQTAGAGSAVATGGPIATFTKVSPIPALVGSAVSSKVYWAPTTNTFTTAPAYYAPIPYNLFAAATNTAIAPVVSNIKYDGSFGVAPNTALSICATHQTSTGVKFVVKLTWEEVPV